MRVDLDRARGEADLARLGEETSARRLADQQRLHEARERSLHEDAELERTGRAAVEDQLSTLRRQHHALRRDAATAHDDAQRAADAAAAELHAAHARLRAAADGALARAVDNAHDAAASEAAPRAALRAEEAAAFRALLAEAAAAAAAARLRAATAREEAAARSGREAVREAEVLRAQLAEEAARRAEAAASVQELCREVDRLAAENAECAAGLAAARAEREGLAGESLRAGTELGAVRQQHAQQVEALRGDVMRVQLEWSRVSEQLAAEQAAAAGLRAQLADGEAARSQGAARTEGMAGELEAVARALEQARGRADVLVRLVEAAVSDAPAEGIGRVVWAIHAEGDASPNRGLLAACEALTRITTVHQMSKGMRADFDFIVATRETLAGELATCKHAVCEQYADATRLMEEVLHEASLAASTGGGGGAVGAAGGGSGGASARAEREALSRVCAGLGGLRSQIQWLVQNCLSDEERAATGLPLCDDSVGRNTIEELRRPALAAAASAVATPKKQQIGGGGGGVGLLVSPPAGASGRRTPANAGADDGMMSCVGSEGLSPRTLPRAAGVPTPGKRGVRFVSPPGEFGSPAASLSSPPNRLG